MNIIGIDPGSDGAAAIITPDHELRVIRFKYESERDLILQVLSETLEPCTALLEKVGSRPGQGVKSMFTFGKNCGFIRGVVMALDIPLEDVPPQTWQKGVGIGGSFPSQAERKRAHKAMAQQLFPKHKVTLSNADAILIAEYGYRRLYHGKR